MSLIVVAIGGNAILNPEKGNPAEQEKKIDETCREIAQIVREGNDVVLTHGNGPQIGNILAMQEECGFVHPQPLDICGAQTQGMLGYSLQRSLANTLLDIGIKKEVATIITQVVVDESCNSFNNPTKPIGLYYPEEKAQRMMAGSIKMIQDKKGYRRVVPSPMPIRIVEEALIKKLISKGALVIAAGGGGIPVIDRNGSLMGVEAVIDKDLTGSLMAKDIGAETLLILTDVENAALNYGKSSQIDLHEITVSDGERYIKEGHFGKGSMEPKMLAAVRFIRSGGNCAIISSLNKALAALAGKAGTRIITD
ncbi:MAG TPA: carbamate kinase [Candidatus Methylomirabilis sp.]|nr:carbamate kinase [Candidatus Methylomirabilis sp.]